MAIFDQLVCPLLNLRGALARFLVTKKAHYQLKALFHSKEQFLVVFDKYIPQYYSWALLFLVTGGNISRQFLNQSI